MPLFNMKRQIYYRITSLLPSLDGRHKCLQMYFIGDDHEEMNARCKISTDIKRSIISQLRGFLYHKKTIQCVFFSKLQLTWCHTKLLFILSKTRAGEHIRSFHALTIDKMAIVFVVDQFQIRNIVLHQRKDQLKTVAGTHQCYDDLHHPITFWDGTNWYHFKVMIIITAIGEKTNVKCSAMNYYITD